ncbi:unnamed protein product [Onchocerca flexuosa]|uniref:SH3 domain-containing protein n=1 Tax=Onchocerca flexuosa TaxID=387005 RepID=A0A183H147_9BILA|nr:unnamed protein product [Onchocerca flexuosa]
MVEWKRRHNQREFFRSTNIIPKNAETLKEMFLYVVRVIKLNHFSYRVLYDYKPRNEDELELQENDVVFVVEKCDDGWFIG